MINFILWHESLTAQFDWLDPNDCFLMTFPFIFKMALCPILMNIRIDCSGISVF